MKDTFDRIESLRAEGRPFVLATVVRAERPTSSKPGAKAIVTADGALEGWVGGSCAEPTVRREARKALQDGQPRFLRLCPPESMGRAPQEGVVEVALTCVSGGTLEIFLEPQTVQPHLVVVGHLATSMALASMGKELGYRVTVMGPEASADRFPRADRVLDDLDFQKLDLAHNAYVVIASHGNYDEQALVGALQTEAGYVALIASKTRAESVLEYLRRSGISEQRLERLKCPAGIDLGAVTPEEIALSILAEVVQVHRRLHPSPLPADAAAAPAPQEAKDPVCGMMVEIERARYTSTHDGVTYYFCSAGCQRAFEAEPQAYLHDKQGHAG